MPSSFAPNEQTVISKRTPLPAPAEMLSRTRPSQIGKSLEGQQLGQFLLEEFVGGGGMGAVFRAVDKTLDRIVAVKVVSSDQTDEDTLRRFRNEAQSAARLDHPNIARVYSVGEEAGWNYIVFEFIEGVNVRDLVSHKGPLPLDEAISYVVQVADALEHASQRDVVHRDIKPSNLLVMQDGRAKLVDMGLARLHQVESSAEDLTATGVTLGTFDYISPEQARDPRDTDVRSDLYSLGCTWYYMLTGMAPFPEGTVLQKLLSHSSEAPPDPRDLRADLPGEVSAIAMKLMAKLPSQRYQRPSELTVELMKLCEKLGFVAPTRGGLSSPRQNPAAGKLAYHLPWAVPVCMLFAIAFGVDALLPKPAEVTFEMAPAIDTPDVNSAVIESGSSPQQPAPPTAEVAPASTNATELPASPSTEPPAAGTPPAAERTGEMPVVAPSPSEDSSAASRGENGRPSVPEPASVMPVQPKNAVPEIDSETVTASPSSAVSGANSPSPTNETSDASPTTSPAASTAERLVVIPDAPEGPPDPMVVRSLEQALRRLADQPDIRVIELRCNRYEAKPLTIDLRSKTIDSRRSLTIESGQGFSPLLVFDPRDASPQAKRMLHLLSGSLTLRGLHFRLQMPYSSEDGWTLFHLNQVEELTLEQCTLTVQNDYAAEAAFFYIQAPRMPAMSVPGINVTPPHRPNIALQSCIARGEATFVRATEGLPFNLDFTQGLLATTERMVELGQLAEAVKEEIEIVKINLRQVTAEMRSGFVRATMRDAEAHLPQLKINTWNSLLDHDAGAPLIEYVGILNVAGAKLELSGEWSRFPHTNILWRLEPRSGEILEVLWDARGDEENSWYKINFSERFASWLDPARNPVRIMHQVTPNDYLVAEGEELGFDPALLPELPPEDDTADPLD